MLVWLVAIPFALFPSKRRLVKKGLHFGDFDFSWRDRCCRCACHEPNSSSNKTRKTELHDKTGKLVQEIKADG
jgi:hypothetical protein